MSLGKIAYHANCRGALGGNAQGVTSITEPSYRTFGDMARTFGDIAAAGRSGGEVCDRNLQDYTAADLRRLLAGSGLELVAAYAGGKFIFYGILAEEPARVSSDADRAAELGAPHLVIGGGTKRCDGIRDADCEKLGAPLEKVKAIPDKRGSRVRYHPHLDHRRSPGNGAPHIGLTAIDFCPGKGR